MSAAAHERSSCFICGCAKDCDEYLPAVFANIRRISELGVFKQVYILVAYDESADSTLEVLQRELANGRGEILMGNPDLRSPVRVVNIARARNAILSRVRECAPEYMIMMDFDNVCMGPMDLNALLDGMLRRDEWDALSFNRHFYYDIWALSWPPFIFSCWHWSPSPIEVVGRMKTQIMQELRERGPDGPLMECLSAFGGFAIYRLSAFAGCNYLPELSPYLFLYPLQEMEAVVGGRRFHAEPDYAFPGAKAPLGDCEHRHFHLEAIFLNGARIRISPRCLFLSRD